MRPDVAKNPAVEAQAKADVKRAMGVLDKHLLHNTFMVGDQVTFADISIACAIFSGSSALDASFTNLLRWYGLITSQPEVVAILGEVKVPGGGKAARAQEPAKKGEDKKEPAPAAKKEAKEKQPKEEKKAEPKKENKKD